MPIIRHRQEKDYTVLPNALLQDKRLHLIDKGLLSYMLSLPPAWEFSIAGLCAVVENDGITAIRSSLARIESAGYLKRERVRGADGKLANAIWTVSDEPISDNHKLGCPHVANQMQYNTTSDTKTHEGNRANVRKTDSGCRNEEFSVRYDW